MIAGLFFLKAFRTIADKWVRPGLFFFVIFFTKKKQTTDKGARAAFAFSAKIQR